ncbi:MAG: hypothetical protein AAFV98_21995 [Chloroflexota bacterium]
MASKITALGIITILLIAIGRLVWRLYETEAELVYTRAQLTKAHAISSVTSANGNGTHRPHDEGADPSLPLREVYTGFDQTTVDAN